MNHCLEFIFEDHFLLAILFPKQQTLENVITCLRVMQTKVHLLQSQSQLLNDEIKDLKNQQLVKNYKLILIQNNPLYDVNDDDDDDV
jgi:hypothetical protein